MPKQNARGPIAELIGIPRNPVPSGVDIRVIETVDGVALRSAVWAATREPLRGTVAVLPGRNECIEKYFETIADLRRRGFAVAALDWRGQGGSAHLLDNPLKGHVGDFKEYDTDLETFAREVVLTQCPGPYLALGHSMGAHVLLRAAALTEPWFDTLIASAPMLEIHRDMVRYPAALVAGYAEGAGRLGFSERYALGHGDGTGLVEVFEDNPLTSDRERFERNLLLVQSAPELALGGPTVGWLAAALRSMSRLAAPDIAGRIRLPALMFAAGRDRIVDPRAIHRLADNLKSGTLVQLPDARHEILQEREDIRTRFWAAFDAYVGIELMAV